jgi:hypothetical protein
VGSNPTLSARIRGKYLSLGGKHVRSSGEPPVLPTWRYLLSRWYQGQYIPPPKSDVFIFTSGSFTRHWTSRLAHWLVEFWLKEWKWIIPVLISAIGLIVAIVRLT